MNSKQFKFRLKNMRKLISSKLDIVFISVFGSYNYDLVTPISDVDWKVIYIPTLDDLINRTPDFDVIDIPNGKVEIYSLPRFMNDVKQFEIPSLEVIFCNLCWVNPEHETLFNTIKDIVANAIKNNKKQYAEKILDSIKKIYTRFVVNTFISYNPRKAYNIPRMKCLLEEVLNDKGYNLIPSEEYKRRIMNYKLGNVNKEQASQECLEIINSVEAMINNYSNNVLDRYYDTLDNLVKDTITNIIVQNHQAQMNPSPSPQPQNQPATPIIDENEEQEIVIRRQRNVENVSIILLILVFIPMVALTIYNLFI